MRLIPADRTEPSEWDDWWEEKPGLPAWDGVWRRDPDDGRTPPEFEFEEGHERNRNDPPPRFLIGSWEHCHIRLKDARIPRRHALLFKQGRSWYLERIDANEAVYCGDQPLVVGKWHVLKDGDEFSLVRPPTHFKYRIQISEEDNWYLDFDREGNWRQNFDGDWYLLECPSLHPSRLQYPATVYPTVPEDLKRLAWQTDQMRRRSEEDQVRVSDWAAFARHAKSHFLWYGMEAKPFRGTICDPKELPSPRPFRALSRWIADVVSKERQVPGVKTPLAVEEALRISAQQAEMKASMAKPMKGLPLSKGTAAGVLQKGVFKGKGRGRSVLQAKGNAPGPLDRDLRDWLEGLDKSGALLQFEVAIAEKFGSLRGLSDRMVSVDGTLSIDFFEAAGVKKLGHKRTFEKFFRELAVCE